MKAIALFGISIYQRHVSPRKGYYCAYRSRTGRRSCSMLGSRAIRRYGIWSGVAILRQRFVRCAEALQALRALPAGSRGQQGFCDAGCDLPIPDADCIPLDICSCLPDDCGDWGGRKKREQPAMVDLAPPPAP